MNKQNFDKLIVVNEDKPLDPREIATDDNLDTWTKESQFKPEDECTMTPEKLAARPPGLGHARLHLPDGVAQNYDLQGFGDEDWEILKEAQEEHAMADLANVAAAQAAGYTYSQRIGPDGRFYSRLEKLLRGELGEADTSPFYAEASDITGALADAACVSALNAQRSQRYGFTSPAAPSLDNVSGAAEVVDAT